jgi:hypothetical protein
MLVPWRGRVEPFISLPGRAVLPPLPEITNVHLEWVNYTSSNCPAAVLTEQALEDMLVTLQTAGQAWAIVPRRLTVSPQVKKLIDTDPVIRRAAEMAIRGEYLPEELGLYDQTWRS